MNFLGRRLSTRIQLVAMLLVAAAFTTLALILDYHQQQNLIESYRAKFDQQLKIHGDRLAMATRTLGQDALFLSRTPPIQGIVRAKHNAGLDPRDGNKLATWEQRLTEIFSAFLNAHPDYLRASYVGRADNGLELIRVERQAQGRIGIADRQPLAGTDLFKAAINLRPGQVFLSDLQSLAELEAGQQPKLQAATPVPGPDGEAFGLLLLDMDTFDLLASIRSNLPQGVRTHVFDDRGRRLLPNGQFQPASLGPQVPAVDSSSMLKTRVADDWQYVSFSRVRFDPLAPQRHVLLAFELTNQQLNNELRQTRITLVAGGLALALLTGGLIWLYLRGIMQPLAKVTRAARLIAAGKHALNLPRSGHSEVLELADAFRHMFDRITARENDYQRLNIDLEQRVKQRTAELRLAASVLDNTSEGVMITDIHSIIVAVNPAFTTITGYSAEEAIGRTPRLLRSAHHDPAFYRELWLVLSTSGHWHGEIWNRRKNGEVFLERLSINMVPGEDGRPVNYVGIFNDITDLWRRDEQIRFLAYHDALTGLPNRALLLDRLGHAMLVAERERSSLALLFLDLDRFKQVNDNLGHEVGDLLLQEVAKRIKSCLRETDTVARLGGDEFIVMLENLATRQPAGEIAESLISSLSSPYLLKDHPIEIGVSAGIALFPDHGRDVEELIQHADQAMYAAKNAGRGVVRYYQEAQAVR